MMQEILKDELFYTIRALQFHQDTESLLQWDYSFYQNTSLQAKILI